MAIIRDKEVYYVCAPTSFVVSATSDVSNRRISVIFRVGEKEVMVHNYRTTLQHYQNTNQQDMLDSVVKSTIKKFMQRPDHTAKKQLDFLAYNVYTSLKEVRTKLGALLWRR